MKLSALALALATLVTTLHLFAEDQPEPELEDPSGDLAPVPDNDPLSFA